MGGYVGFNYPGVETASRLSDFDLKEHFSLFQLMERTALKEFNG